VKVKDFHKVHTIIQLYGTYRTSQQFLNMYNNFRGREIPDTWEILIKLSEKKLLKICDIFDNLQISQNKLN